MKHTEPHTFFSEGDTGHATPARILIGWLAVFIDDLHGFLVDHQYAAVGGTRRC